MQRVVVGLSGGVDSSVAAYLLKEQGYEVIGLFMRNWLDDTVTISEECPWLEDSNDAMQVAQKLNIPFQILDLSKEYKERIVDYMFREYSRGYTPNPDVLCNREIKFDIFLEQAIKLGADFVATGHYCQKETIEKDGQVTHRLLAGADPSKDQSYFLCQVNQSQLARALFPIGHLQKSEVREIAKTQDLVTAEKKDSQGLCFVGKVKLPVFLQQQLEPKDGEIIEVAADDPILHRNGVHLVEEHAEAFKLDQSHGEVIGTHQGAHYFTIGQRKGLGVGGKVEPLFVIGTDTDQNRIYVGQGERHPGLYRKALRIAPEDIHWVRPDMRLDVGEKADYLCRIRYRQALQKATLIQKTEGLYIEFETPQRGIARGQFAAWYAGEELIGSGVIA
ncbi:MAG: tRNA 2-thiouridine(34) synthase MnmA [Flavobacteriales bacterium]|nr:tRNA 2-thiouridine(34) synthase MnmA [Flavobacteriales bacterium]